MKVEDVKVGTKIKFISPDKCNDLKTVIRDKDCLVALYIRVNIILEVIEIDQNDHRVYFKIFDWDKSNNNYTVEDLENACLVNSNKLCIEFHDFYIFEEYLEQDHSGMIYNPYNDSWSYL